MTDIYPPFSVCHDCTFYLTNLEIPEGDWDEATANTTLERFHLSHDADTLPEYMTTECDVCMDDKPGDRYRFNVDAVYSEPAPDKRTVGEAQMDTLLDHFTMMSRSLSSIDTHLRMLTYATAAGLDKAGMTLFTEYAESEKAKLKASMDEADVRRLQSDLMKWDLGLDTPEDQGGEDK